MQTAWVYQMAHALQFNYPPRHEEVARHLGNGVLDLVIKSGMSTLEGGIQLALSESVLELPWTRGRLQMPISGLDRASLDFTGYGFRITGPAGNALGTAFHEGGSVPECQGLALENLEVIDGTDITITHRNPTLLAFYPKDPIARANPLATAFLADEEQRFRTALAEGLDWVRRLWPEAHADICGNVAEVTPLRDDQQLKPNNQSVHAFRGLIATSPRPGYFSAQMWVHESGHNKFSTILDLYPLIRKGAEEPAFHSPFVGTRRPWTAVLHGLFSFARDLEMTRRMIGIVPEREGFIPLLHGWPSCSPPPPSGPPSLPLPS